MKQYVIDAGAAVRLPDEGPLPLPVRSDTFIRRRGPVTYGMGVEVVAGRLDRVREYFEAYGSPCGESNLYIVEEDGRVQYAGFDDLGWRTGLPGAEARVTAYIEW